jgi:hypothetical protein
VHPFPLFLDDMMRDICADLDDCAQVSDDNGADLEQTPLRLAAAAGAGAVGAMVAVGAEEAGAGASGSGCVDKAKALEAAAAAPFASRVKDATSAAAGTVAGGNELTTPSNPAPAAPSASAYASGISHESEGADGRGVKRGRGRPPLNRDPAPSHGVA